MDDWRDRKRQELLASNEAVLTVEEAALILRISRPSAYEAVRTGQIPSVRVGRRILIPRARLDAWLAGEEVS